MATANSFAGSLNGLFKETYGDHIENLIPEGKNRLTNRVKFASKEKQPGKDCRSFG